MGRRSGTSASPFLGLLAVVATAIASLAGCDPGSAASGGAVHVDPTALPPIEFVREIHIDGEEHDLVRIGDVAPGPGGLVALIQHQDRAVRIFDAEGRPRGTFGRAGQGPGEFGLVSRIGWVGDQLWVWDGQQRRVTFVRVSAEGGALELDRIVSLRELVPHAAGEVHGIPFPEFVGVAVEGAREDGTLHAVMRPPPPEGVHAAFDSVTWHVRLSAEGEVAGVLGRYHDPFDEVLLRSPEFAVGTSVPWVMAPVFAVSPSGHRLLIASPRIEEAPRWSLDLALLDHEGDTVHRVRGLLDGEPLPRRVADSVLAAREERLQSLSTDLVAAFRAAVKTPPIYPTLSSAVVGEDGWAWIRLQGPGGNAIPGPWIVADPEGRFVAATSQPGGRVVALGGDGRVWMVHTDPMGIQSLARYRTIFEP